MTRLALETPAPEGALARFAQIAGVAAAKGFGHYAERLGLGRFAAPGEPRTGKSDARRFREALEALGPTFIKLGQMMAGRSDIFPDELIAELGSLHQHAPQFPAEVARRIVEEETGRRIDELYAAFDEAPMAAASMAQVHGATLFDGTAVIVKVQRPGIAATVEADIAVLRRVARLLGGAMPSLRAFNLPDLVEELAETLRGELDFEREAHNAERFAAANAGEPGVYVPRIVWDATTRRVLTMEHSPGLRVDRAPGDAARKAATARNLTRLFLVQVFEHGLFHGDPHPGNIFLVEDGRLCFHDFGALGTLSPQVQAPGDLRERALVLAANIVELCGKAAAGQGAGLARETLASGAAWRKFQAICEAQGGMREPPRAAYTHTVPARSGGRVAAFDNRRLARAAKLAGAPHDAAAGMEVHVRLGDRVEIGQPLFTLHAESPGELAYARSYLQGIGDVVAVVAAP